MPTIESMKPAPLGIRSRALALFVGSIYLFILARLLAVVTDLPAAGACGIVFTSASIIMVVLTVFGVRAYQFRDNTIRFRLSTALLITVPLGIYLAAIRLALVRVEAGEMPWVFWVFAALLAAIFMVLTTAVLLWLAEALMWLGVLTVRTIGFLRHPRQ